MRCKKCGETIVIFECDGGVYILEKPYRGFVEQHFCGDYDEVLSEYMMKKLEVGEYYL